MEDEAFLRTDTVEFLREGGDVGYELANAIGAIDALGLTLAASFTDIFLGTAELTARAFGNCPGVKMYGCETTARAQAF